ncbi:MAG: nitroreductase [Firmicutes bacterium]|nr:nitroreductase [Candidatus Colivicinus equi]
MNEMINYYEIIFKRKSFHLFRDVGKDKLSQTEIEDIQQAYLDFVPLYPEIKTAIKIVPANTVNFKRDAEYCILIYSEKKDNYLMNAGYIGEQLDLWLVKHNIGSLWFGIGKPDELTYNGLDYVIMFAIHKINDETKYRKDMFKSKRKDLEEIWSGDDLNIANIVRFSPSACNSQPWYVENKDDELTVYRYKKPGKRGIMPAKAVSYFNRIDIGIFLCILEICMQKNELKYDRTLFVDNGEDIEYTKSAVYKKIKG